MEQTLCSIGILLVNEWNICCFCFGKAAHMCKVRAWNGAKNAGTNCIATVASTATMQRRAASNAKQRRAGFCSSLL